MAYYDDTDQSEEPEVISVVGPSRSVKQSPDDSSTTQDHQTLYDNSKDIDAIRAAADSRPTRGGSANPGIWGLLPENIQHGTFRNILGAIGDAMLVGAGRDAEYGPRMERQQVGDAMAGYQNDPDAAANRIAATGAPGAIVAAKDVASWGLQRDLKNQQQQSLNDERASRQQDRITDTITARSASMQNYLYGAKDADDYASRLARVNSGLKRLGGASAEVDLYAPSADEWEASDFNPKNRQGSGDYGATAAQSAKIDSTNRSLDQKAAATETAHEDRVRGQDLTYKARTKVGNGSSKLPTTASETARLIAKSDSGQTLSPYEQKFLDKQTASKGSSASGGRQLLSTGKDNSRSGSKSYKGEPVFSSTSDPEFKKLPKGAAFYVDGQPDKIRYKN